MNKKMMLAACVAACVMTGCEKENDKPVPDGGTGKFLIGTTVKNPDGMSGSSYFQLLPSLSGNVNNSNAIQVGFASPIEVIGNDIFVLSTSGKDATHQAIKYTYRPGQTLEPPVTLGLPPNSMAGSVIRVDDRKAYIPLYTTGRVWIIDPQAMQKTDEIDLTSHAHGDASPEPAYGLVRDGYYYLPLDQINEQYMPYDDYQQVDVAVIDIQTDKVVKIASEKTTGLTFPTRPMLKNMIFTDEQNDLYMACTGYFGFSPDNKKNGFVCIPSGKDEFDTSKSWDISETVIEGTAPGNYKSASVYNCKYLGNGKLAAYVCIAELTDPNNKYTSRNTMAVLVDLKAKTIRKIDGIPLTDGHSVFIDTYRNQVVFGAYGESKVGFFTCNFDGSNVQHILTTAGNPVFMHSFE
jgi:hypothetical protein